MFGVHEDHDREVADARAGLATSAAGAALGTAAGNGLAGTAVGALAGPALMLVRSTIDHARDTRERRAERALQIAADIIHRLNGINGIDFIGRWSATDGVRFDLLVEVIEAVVHTPLQAKIEALAEVLVEGLQTDGALPRTCGSRTIQNHADGRRRRSDKRYRNSVPSSTTL